MPNLNHYNNMGELFIVIFTNYQQSNILLMEISQITMTLAKANSTDPINTVKQGCKYPS